jgi:GT2 family glycosyltransferase
MTQCFGRESPTPLRDVTIGPHVAVIVLHWGATAMTARCLRSLRDAVWPGRISVLVVDNTTRLDEAMAAHAGPLETQILRPPGNLGFAEGCTLGVSAALARDADFLLLLNNDAVVDADFLGPLVKAADQYADAGLLSPQIVHLDRPRQAWYRGGKFSPWTGIPTQGHRRRVLSRDQPPRDVDYATGCAMLIRPAVIQRIGSFDREFFAYCEDLDLSIRACRAGFRVLFVPASLVYHDVGDEPRRAELRIYYSTRNLLEVMRKHASWYMWFSFAANFLARWVGFFVVLALVRGQPRYITVLVRGLLDFARRRLGPFGDT